MRCERGVCESVCLGVGGVRTFQMALPKQALIMHPTTGRRYLGVRQNDRYRQPLGCVRVGTSAWCQDGGGADRPVWRVLCEVMQACVSIESNLKYLIGYQRGHRDLHMYQEHMRRTVSSGAMTAILIRMRQPGSGSMKVYPTNRGRTQPRQLLVAQSRHMNGQHCGWRDSDVLIYVHTALTFRTALDAR